MNDMRDATMKREIEKFLEQFPTDAANWAQATDEVRDLARFAREYLEEYEGVIVEPVDFRHAKTPAEWNTKGRAFILGSFERMQERTRKAYYEKFRAYFGQEED